MDESYLKALTSVRDRGNYREVFVNALNLICTDVKLGGIRSVLSIGPGDGWYEIEFIKHCEANISKFIGVEPDHASVERLRTSLRSSLPGVESQVFETDIQHWEGPGSPIDLITMFNVLYYVPAGERLEFLKKVHDSWLVSGGCVAVVTASRTKSSGDTHIIPELLGSPLPKWEDIATDFQKAGFSKQYAQEMHAWDDFTNPDENLLHICQSVIKRPITLADLRDAMKGPLSEGKADEFNVMAIFKSTS